MTRKGLSDLYVTGLAQAIHHTVDQHGFIAASQSPRKLTVRTGERPTADTRQEILPKYNQTSI
jgi:hypothetical protein